VAKELKNLIDAEFRRRFDGVDSCILVDYRGLNSEQTEDLRSELRRKNVRMRVVHNRLVKRVFADSEAPESFRDLFRGPTAVVFCEDDGAVSASKYVVEWAKKNEDAVAVKGGLFQGKTLDVGEVQRLAEIPDLPTMQRMVAGMLLGPLTFIASATESLLGHFAGCVEARQKELE